MIRQWPHGCHEEVMSASMSLLWVMGIAVSAAKLQNPYTATIDDDDETDETTDRPPGTYLAPLYFLRPSLPRCTASRPRYLSATTGRRRRVKSCTYLCAATIVSTAPRLSSSDSSEEKRKTIYLRHPQLHRGQTPTDE